MAHSSFLEKFYQLLDSATPENHSEAIFVLHDQLNIAAWPDWVGEKSSRFLSRVGWVKRICSVCGDRCSLTCWV